MESCSEQLNDEETRNDEHTTSQHDCISNEMENCPLRQSDIEKAEHGEHEIFHENTACVQTLNTSKWVKSVHRR